MALPFLGNWNIYGFVGCPWGNSWCAAGSWAVVFGLSKHLGDRLIEGVKAQHSRELAEMQNAFSMGATSHMAAVAFDKHIGFCEEYIDAVSKVLQTLIPEGRKGKPDVTDILKVRQKWALWLTDDIENKLDRFEELVAKVGSEAPILDTFGEHVPIGVGIKSVIGELRKVLATEELTALRSALVARSLKSPMSDADLPV